MATQMVNQATGNSLFCTSTYSSISLDNDMYGLHDLSKADMAAPRLIMLANVALTGELNSGGCDYTLEGERQMAELTTVNDNSFSDSEGDRLEDSPTMDIQSRNFTMDIEPAECSKEGTSENDGTLLSNTLEEEVQKDKKAQAPSTTDDKIKCVKSKPFRCKPCQYKAESEEEFVHHIKIHSAKIYVDNDSKKNPQGKEADSSIPEESDISKGPIQCDRCGYNTNRFDHYLAHLKHHNKAGENERVYKCTICTYSTVSEYHWKKHLRNHYPRILYTCSQCSYFSDRKNNYIQHIRTHTGERPYQCILCPYSSSQKTHLTRHMRTHSGEKPFKCEQCSYVASNQHEVTRHARQVHNGPKPLTCPHCDYKTADRSNFKKHVELHVNPRQFLCPVCDYAASKKCNLQYHIKSRHSGCTNITMDVSKVKLRTKKGDIGVADVDANKQTENGNIIDKSVEETVKAEKRESCGKAKKSIVNLVDGQVAKKRRLSSTQKKIKTSDARPEKILDKSRKSSCVKRKSDLLENSNDTQTSTVKKKKLKNSRKVITNEMKDDIPKKLRDPVKKKENSFVKSKHKKKTRAQSNNNKKNMLKKMTDQKVEKGNQLGSKKPIASDITVEQSIIGKVANENDSEQASDVASINNVNYVSTESGLLNYIMETELSINTNLEIELSTDHGTKSEHVSKAITALVMQRDKQINHSVQVDMRASISKQEKTQNNLLMNIETISSDLLLQREEPNQVLFQNGISTKVLFEKGSIFADLPFDSAKTTVMQVDKPTSCLLKDYNQPDNMPVDHCKPTCYLPLELCEPSADLLMDHGDPSSGHLVVRGRPYCEHLVKCDKSSCGQCVLTCSKVVDGVVHTCNKLVEVEEPACNKAVDRNEPICVQSVGRVKLTFAQPVEAMAEPTVTQPVEAGADPTVTQPVDAGADPTVAQQVVAGAKPTVAQPVPAGVEPSIAQPLEAGIEPTVAQPVAARAEPTIAQPVVAPTIKPVESRDKPTNTRLVVGGDEPAGLQPPGGDEPAGLQPPGGDEPAGLQPPGMDEPAGLQPPGGDEPAGLQAPAGDEPAGLQPPAGDEPAGLQPPGGDEPAGLQPPGGDEPAGDEPAGLQPPAGDEPAGLQPPAGDEPTGIQPTNWLRNCNTAYSPVSTKEAIDLSLARQEETELLVGRQKHSVVLTEWYEPTDLSFEGYVRSVENNIPADLLTKQKPIYLSRGMGSPPVDWSEPFNLSMEWHEPCNLSLVEPSDLSMRKVDTADLSVRNSKPADLSVLWEEPVDLSVERSDPADPSIGISQPADLKIGIPETIDLLVEGSQFSALKMRGGGESFDLLMGRVDPIDLSMEKCEPIDLSVEKGMSRNLEMSEGKHFGKLDHFYNLNCVVGSDCQFLIKGKAKYNVIPEHTLQSNTKLSVEIAEPHNQLQSICVLSEVSENQDTAVQQGNDKEYNSGAKEDQNSRLPCTVSRSQSIDIDEDEGIHSHDGSEISDNVSEMSYDSGLNGVPSVQKTLTSDSKVVLNSETKESFVCIFCDRTFRKEEEYTKHLRRHLVNVYYLKKAAKDIDN